MAATAGITFDATTIAYATTSGGSYTDFGEITDLGGLGETADPIDMTHTTSPNNRSEYIPGIADGQEFTLTVNYTRSLAGLIEATLFNASLFYKVTLTNGDTFVFPGIMTGYEHLGAVKDKWSSNVTIKICNDKVDHTGGA
jgi:hypothetical protein